MPKPGRQEIDEGVFLYTTRNERPTSFGYEIENAAFQELEFTIIFDGTIIWRTPAAFSDLLALSRANYCFYPRPFPY
jgi:hypothetical protein